MGDDGFDGVDDREGVRGRLTDVIVVVPLAILALVEVKMIRI